MPEGKGMLLIGLDKPEKEEKDTGNEDAVDAAELILRAIAKKDAKALSKALQLHTECCTYESEED